MFNPKNLFADTLLNQAIENVHTEMMPLTSDDQDYAKMVDQLTKLYAIRANMQKSRISPEAVLTAVVNILGIVVIVNHEQTHALTSKALGFVLKTR